MSRRDRSRPAHERTQEERERDREERERRRAQRSGGAVAEPPPPPPLPVEEPPTVEQSPIVEEPSPAEVPPPVEEPEPDIEVLPPPAPVEESVVLTDATGRSWLPRAAALLALIAVVVAVVLLGHSLLRSSDKKTPPPPPVVKVVIPEGKTRAQIAEIAEADKLSGSYRRASRHSSQLDPSDYGAPHDTSSLEGFLFPATYDMNPGESVNRLVKEQLLAFTEHFGAAEIARAKALEVTPYELLTVASMVEREAQVLSDRAKIAAVIYNRLHEGMPLGIDATIYYAVELRSGIATYTRELTEAQLHMDSRYNTRTHTGLPPTPISNPGVASIRAAAFPAHVRYLYYVAAADGCGEQVFSTSSAEFEANAAAYKAAVAKNGGHPPTCKHGK